MWSSGRIDGLLLETGLHGLVDRLSFENLDSLVEHGFFFAFKAELWFHTGAVYGMTCGV